MAKFQEISFDVFLQVIWEDKRIKHKSDTNMTLNSFTELKIEERHKIWVNHFFKFKIQFLFLFLIKKIKISDARFVYTPTKRNESFNTF